MKSTLIMPRIPGWQRASLYKCEPPMTDELTGEQHTFVVASTIQVQGQWETYLFPTDETGKATSMGELAGSMKDVTDHATCFASVGYELVLS